MGESFSTVITVGLIILALVLYKIIRPMFGGSAVKNGDDLLISPNDIYDQVKIMISNGNHTVAQKLAKKYLDENPKHDKLRLLLARSYYDFGAFSEAIEHIEKLKVSFPDRIELFIMLADAYQRTGQNNNAIDTYLDLLDSNPDSVEILTPLAELYISVNHKKSALNIYKRLLNLDIKEQEKINYYYRVASIYKDLGEFDNAIEYVHFGLNTDKNNIKLLYLYKELSLAVKDVEKEIEVMSKLLVLAPNDTHLQLDLINLYYKTEKYAEALDIALPALNTPAADTEAIKNIIANIYLKTNKIVESINILEEAMSEHPDSIRLTETSAFAYKLYGKYEESVTLYKRLVEWADLKRAKIYNKELSSVYCNWALHLYNLGDHTGAFTKFDEALRLNPDNYEIYEGLGRVNFLAKNYSDAIRQIQKAIDLDPKNCEHYIFLADIYYEIDNIYEAERMYKEAIFIDKNHPMCRAKLGIIKLKQKDIQSALTHLGVAVKFDPNNWDYLYNLALAYELSSDKVNAIDCYNKVLKLNPEHKESAKNLKILQNSK